MGEILFSYPGVISEINQDTSGKKRNVIIDMNVNGKHYFVSQNVGKFDFEVQLGVPVIIQTVLKKTKTILSVVEIIVRKAEPESLSEESLEILKTL